MAVPVRGGGVFEHEQGAEPRGDLDGLRAELDALRHELDALREDHAALRRDADGLRRRLDEERARGREERQLADAMPHLVWTARADGVVDYYNRRVEQYAGIHRSDRGTWDWAPVLHPDDREATIAAWARAVETGTDYDIEHRVAYADGRFAWHVSRGVALRDASGAVVRWYGTATDIDAAKRAQAALALEVAERERAVETLRKSEARLRLAMAVGRSFAFDWNPETDAVQRAESCAGILGLEGSEAVQDTGARFFQRIHPDDRGAFVELLGKLSPEHDEYRTSYRVIRPDGSIVVLEESGRASFDAAGKLTRLFGMTADITERKRVEDAVHASELRFRNLAEGIPGIVFTSHADGSNEYTSNAFYEYSGLPPGSGEGHGWRQVLHPDDLERVAESWRRAIHVGAPFEVEGRMRRADGEYRWFVTRAVPERDAAGNLVRWIGTAFDVDDRRRLEDALRDADRRKDEFLAMLAHELRNPLAPIRTAVEVMKLSGAETPALARPREVIERQVMHMARLIDDLLDVSRIVRGKISLKREPSDLVAVVREVADDYFPSMETHGITLAVKLPSEPAWVDGDRVRLAQIVGNLLHNADKFTDSGGHVSVEVSLDRAADVVVLRVTDDGIGLDSTMLSRVFEPFAQADLSLDRRKGGLGLGLALVRGLVELHGGSVAAASPGLGRGASFTVRLPLLGAPGAGV
ncbi:PAS domain-containing protein, partial [Myxococcota bacterium]|nr:PAS domain-containing protein [Myxococcota bacterium]